MKIEPKYAYTCNFGCNRNWPKPNHVDIQTNVDSLEYFVNYNFIFRQIWQIWQFDKFYFCKRPRWPISIQLQLQFTIDVTIWWMNYCSLSQYMSGGLERVVLFSQQGKSAVIPELTELEHACGSLMVGSHCRSDQFDRPDGRNSPTKLDQLLYTTFPRPLIDRTRPHTTTHDFSTTSTRQLPRCLLDHPDLYTISTRPTRTLLDLYSISTRPDRPGRTEVMGYWSNRGRVDRVLIGKIFYPEQTRSLHDRKYVSRSTRPLVNQYPITFRWLLERLASRSLLEFIDMSKIFGLEAGAMPSKVDHPDHSFGLARSVPSHFIGLDQVYLIGSVNLP